VKKVQEGTTMNQMTLTMESREADYITSRVRFVQSLLNELVKEVETRAVTKDNFKNRAKSVECALKIAREGI